MPHIGLLSAFVVTNRLMISDPFQRCRRALSSLIGFVRHHPGIAAAVFAVAFVLFVLVVSVPRFETNDDAAMMMLAAGLGGLEATEHLVWTSRLLGGLLKWAYESLPAGVNWYACYLYVAHVLGLALLTYAFVRRRPGGFHWVLYMGLLLVFELRYLQLVQFTTTAMVLATGSGFVLLSAGNRTPRTPSVVILLAAVSFLFAGLIRVQVLYLVLFLLGPVMVLHAWRERSITGVGALAASTALCLAIHAWEHHSLREPWRSAYHYASTRAKTTDNPRRYSGTPPSNPGDWLASLSEEAREAYAANQWSENDIKLRYSHFYYDTEVYSQAKFDRILEAYRLFVPFNPLPRLFRWAQDFSVYSLFFVCLLCGVPLAVARGDRRYVIAAGCLSLLALVGMAYATRMRLRVFSSVVLFFGCAAAYFSAGSRRSGGMLTRFPGRIVQVLWLVLFLTILGTALRSFRRSRWTNQVGYVAARKTFEAIGEVSGERNAAVLCTHLIPIEYAFRPSISSILADIDVVWFGWMTHLPSNQAVLGRYGIDHSVRALYETKNLLLLANKQVATMIRTFIAEHYGVDVSLDIVSDLGEESGIRNHRFSSFIYRVRPSTTEQVLR